MKKVIWAVDCFGFEMTPEQVRDDKGPFPFFLYDDSIINDYPYLFSLDTTLLFAYMAGAYVGPREKRNWDIALVYNWNSDFVFSKEAAIKEWMKNKERRLESFKCPTGYAAFKRDKSYEAMKNNFDENILPLIDKNNGISFIIYYPPYSILKFKDVYEDDAILFKNAMAIKKYIFYRLSKYTNVKIFDFQDDKNITHNLNNYKDEMHYSQQINEYIIDSISKNEKMVTATTLIDYLRNYEKQVREVNIPYLIQQK